MKILVLQGSPKGERSNTMQLTRAFLDGFSQNADVQIDTVWVNALQIQPCTGCFSCWNKTPGTCCLADDMRQVLSQMLAADVIVYSFPLYYFHIPSQLKALIDRQLPLQLPFMATDNHEGGAHMPRYDLSDKRHVVISTCGFYTTQGNYDAVTFSFDKILGKDRYSHIFCAQGELFRVPQLKQRTDAYLQLVTTAGKEFATGAISTQTQEALSVPLYPKEAFEQMADASWNTEKPNSTASPARKALSFTKQMAALYCKDAYNGQDIILEMHYTDCQERYQIILTQDGSHVRTEDFLPYTTLIETPLSVWQSISTGEISGQQALMQKQYRVLGDFDVMLQWDRFFGTHTAASPTATATRKTNMLLLLLPWFSIWIFMTITPIFGAVAAFLVSALLPLAYLRYQPTVYECLTVCSITGIGVCALFGVSTVWLVPLSYLLFGVIWMASIFCKVPLTAHYSMHAYGAQRALENPLFLRTNRILTACWGALYLITPIWSYALMRSSIAWSTGIINSLCPIFLGIFTAWFQKWYPAHYATRIT